MADSKKVCLTCLLSNHLQVSPTSCGPRRATGNLSKAFKLKLLAMNSNFTCVHSQLPLWAPSQAPGIPTTADSPWQMIPPPRGLMSLPSSQPHLPQKQSKISRLLSKTFEVPALLSSMVLLPSLAHKCLLHLQEPRSEEVLESNFHKPGRRANAKSKIAESCSGKALTLSHRCGMTLRSQIS